MVFDIFQLLIVLFITVIVFFIFSKDTTISVQFYLIDLLQTLFLTMLFLLTILL